MAPGKRRLLLIDDDRLVRESISAYLIDSGFEVIECADGLKGVELYREQRPDLVISDLRMPGLDGISVIKALHEVDSEVPVVVISGVGVMGDVVESLRLGASDFLIKPLVDLEVLVHSVEKALERHDLVAENRRYRYQLEHANQQLKRNLSTLERDHQAGRSIQERLQPKSPWSFQDYTVAHQMWPSLHLSGDLIDYGLFSRRYLALYFTDVAGHGAASAFVTVWLKLQVSRWAEGSEWFSSKENAYACPAQLLESMNQSLQSVGINTHLTCVAAVLDTEEHILNYCIAGHLPLPIIKNEQGAHYLQGGGKPVGLFPDPTWQVYQTKLEPGDTLMVFTDGVFEIFEDESVIDKEARLLEIVQRVPADISQITRELGIEDGRELPDDITVLLVQRP
jgi:serine phosphatase RsbU (regulator of sigma subunit)